MAVRILVETVRDCYAVLGLVYNVETDSGRFKDYIAMPSQYVSVTSYNGNRRFGQTF